MAAINPSTTQFSRKIKSTRANMVTKKAFWYCLFWFFIIIHEISTPTVSTNAVIVNGKGITTATIS
jgi:hypothetical protein